MKKSLILLHLVLLSFFTDAQDAPARVVSLNDLREMIQSSSAKIKVFNFWATWCAPCIKELPLFEKLNAERSDVTVTLISLDLDLDPNPDKVYKFIARRNLQSEVLLLNEKDPNLWIDQIDNRWSGAIPATLIINTKTGQRKFIERQLRDGEIENIIDELM